MISSSRPATVRGPWIQSCQLVRVEKKHFVSQRQRSHCRGPNRHTAQPHCAPGSILLIVQSKFEPPRSLTNRIFAPVSDSSASMDRTDLSRKAAGLISGGEYQKGLKRGSRTPQKK